MRSCGKTRLFGKMISFRRIMPLLLLSAFLMTGCRKTPEESAVVSKAEGLSEDVIAGPLESGEIRDTDIPEHWQMEELKGEDRVTISADLEFGKMKIGNLPVIEVRNHVFGQEELERLVDYFSDGKELYVPQPYTKQVFRNVISRVDEKQGLYGSGYSWVNPLKTRQQMEAAVEIAPETNGTPEKAEVKFSEGFADQAQEAAKDYEIYENREERIWFEADVGEEREAHIQAEMYEPKVRNSSSFEWMQGARVMEYSAVESARMFFDYNDQQENAFTQALEERMALYEACYEQGAFDRDAGEEQARQVLADLEIDGMSAGAKERILWFSDADYPKGEVMAGNALDVFWIADPAKAEFGYSYTFSREIGGLNVTAGSSSVSETTDDMYSPPFPVETITVTVTESGVKGFVWEGMMEEAKTVTENTELLSFEKIQKKLADQVFYRYSSYEQPDSDTTLSRYTVTDAVLGYAYIPAYENPENAWLVPVWYFTVSEGRDGVDWQNIYYLVNALDGRVITGE